MLRILDCSISMSRLYTQTHLQRDYRGGLVSNALMSSWVGIWINFWHGHWWSIAWLIIIQQLNNFYIHDIFALNSNPSYNYFHHYYWHYNHINSTATTAADADSVPSKWKVLLLQLCTDAHDNLVLQLTVY